jgi:hypothetical protein
MNLSRQRVRVGIALVPLVCAFLIALAALLDPEGSWRSRLLSPPEKEDGSWSAVSMDGRPVDPHDYRLAVHQGRIAGGRDGCNDWSFLNEQPAGTRDRMIFSTLQACPDPNPDRDAYAALRHAGRLQLLADGRLRATAGPHEAIFRRCRWQMQRVVTPQSFSETQVCVPE